MKRGLAFMSAAGVGAGLMYLFDPDRGKYRRALLHDKAIHLKHITADATGKMGRNVSHHIRGAFAELASYFGDGGKVSNDVLEARVRSKLGHVISHTSAVQVEAIDGRIILRGHIPETEVHPLLDAVINTRGVNTIENYLLPDEEARFDATVSNC